MNPRRVMGAHDTAEIFDRAVQERALAVLTLQHGQDWQTFKSRFLERDRKNRYFVLDYLPVDDEPVPVLTAGQYLGVTFRQKSRKLLFATVVEARGHFLLEDKTSVPAIRYRWPESLTELQRRAYHRTPVPDDMTLLVSLWPGGTTARGAAQGAPLQVLTGELADFSCGGALVKLHQNGAPGWLDDQTLGMEMQLPDGRQPVRVDVRFRGARPDEHGIMNAAVQFMGLELSAEGRSTLQRMAGAVQKLNRRAWAAEHGER